MYDPVIWLSVLFSIGSGLLSQSIPVGGNQTKTVHRSLQSLN